MSGYIEELEKQLAEAAQRIEELEATLDKLYYDICMDADTNLRVPTDWFDANSNGLLRWKKDE